MTPGSSFESARNFFFSYGFYILLLLAVLVFSVISNSSSPQAYSFPLAWFRNFVTPPGARSCPARDSSRPSTLVLLSPVKPEVALAYQ